MTQLCDAPRFQQPAETDERAERAHREAEFAAECRKRALEFNAEIFVDGVLDRVGHDQIDPRTVQIAKERGQSAADYITECMIEMMEEHLVALPSPENAALDASEPVDWD